MWLVLTAAFWDVDSVRDGQSYIARTAHLTSQDGTTLLDVLPPPLYDAATLARSAGVVTGRPALGGLAETLEPAIAPLRERR